MPSIYKRLGAVAGSGTIGTVGTIYAAPATAGTSTVLSTIAICNTASTAATYRLNISAATTFDANGYLVFGGSVAANDTIFLTLGVVLDPTNRYLLGSSSAVTVLFSAFGVENS